MLAPKETLAQKNARMRKEIEAREKRIAAKKKQAEKNSYSNQRANSVVGGYKKGGVAKPKKKTVSVEMDGLTFAGTVKDGRKRAVMKVSNPIAGSSKMVDKFRNDGSLKSQKFIDKTAEGKTFQRIKKSVMKKGGTMKNRK